MEPIISPWTIYLIDHFLGVINVIRIMLIVLTPLCAVCYLDRLHDRDTRGSEPCKKIIKICLPILIISLFIPTRDVAYKMLIASYITPDNLGIGKEMTKEMIEWLLNCIVDAVNRIK